MNITIVQGAFLPVPPVAGGAVEKLWFDLGREFARRGLEVTHVSRAWPSLPDEGPIDGVMHRRLNGFDFPRSRVLAKLMDAVYSLRCLGTLWSMPRCDIVVTNTFFLPLLLGLLPQRRRGAIYVSVHRYPQGQMALYRRAARLQCVSTAIADAVRAQSPAVTELVKVVPNYVPSRLDEREVAATWNERRREVLFVGRVHPEKGIQLLIDAFAAIAPAARSGWSLRIVGPHEVAAGGGGATFKEGLEAKARSLNLPVEWSGPIYDRDQLNDAYRRARVFVYPSTAARGEAFPLAPLEAMACGCPAITSDLACFSDYVEPGVNADMFTLGPDTDSEAERAPRLSAVLQGLMADDARQHRYSQAGLQTAQHFTLARVADAFIADFGLLCATPANVESQAA